MENLAFEQGINAQDLRLAEIIGAISHALDLTEGQPPGHSLRCCWLGMHLGQALGLDAQQLSDLYYTLLLKDAGCSSNAARLWEIYGGDERAIKAAFKTVDSQRFPQLARFVLDHVGSGESLAERFTRLLNLSRNGESLARELIQTRCERGSDIARQLGFGEDVAKGIHALDEHWNGRGKPQGLQGDQIPFNAQIALLAQVADVFHALGGASRAIHEVARRSGSWFDPDLVRRFQAIAANPALWEGLQSGVLETAVCALEPESCSILISEKRLDDIAEAFALVVDSKSPFTAGHSRRTALYAEAIAETLGISQERRRWLWRGALLHDLGKLGVSNDILDKPGKLDASEWEAVKKHAQLTEDILGRVHVFRDLAPMAAAHHERLDGQGYPRGLKAEDIPLETRIITVADIFDAITAERPYRGPIPVPEALKMMQQERGKAVDGDCLDALQACLPQLDHLLP